MKKEKPEIHLTIRFWNKPFLTNFSKIVFIIDTHEIDELELNNDKICLAK